MKYNATPGTFLVSQKSSRDDNIREIRAYRSNVAVVPRQSPAMPFARTTSRVVPHMCRLFLRINRAHETSVSWERADVTHLAFANCPSPCCIRVFTRSTDEPSRTQDVKRAKQGTAYMAANISPTQIQTRHLARVHQPPSTFTESGRFDSPEMRCWLTLLIKH